MTKAVSQSLHYLPAFAAQAFHSESPRLCSKAWYLSWKMWVWNFVLGLSLVVISSMFLLQNACSLKIYDEVRLSKFPRVVRAHPSPRMDRPYILSVFTISVYSLIEINDKQQHTATSQRACEQNHDPEVRDKSKFSLILGCIRQARKLSHLRRPWDEKGRILWEQSKN